MKKLMKFLNFVNTARRTLNKTLNNTLKNNEGKRLALNKQKHLVQ